MNERRRPRFRDTAGFRKAAGILGEVCRSLDRPLPCGIAAVDRSLRRAVTPFRLSRASHSHLRSDAADSKAFRDDYRSKKRLSWGDQRWVELAIFHRNSESGLLRTREAQNPLRRETRRNVAAWGWRSTGGPPNSWQGLHATQFAVEANLYSVPHSDSGCGQG